MQMPDFGGYATKNDLKCTDGRTIRRDAFKHDNGKVVPLVWMHNSADPSNILGHARLENREDGVYAHCFFNESDNAKNAKGLVKHGAIKALSIYANKLGQVGKDVRAGVIREVSLVLGGANPGALIDTVSFQHGDFDEDEVDEAIITSGEDLILSHSDESTEETKKEEPPVPPTNDDIQHAEAAAAADPAAEPTVGDILATLNDQQKAAVGFLIEQITEEEDADMQQSDEEDDMAMGYNVFDQTGEAGADDFLTHADFEEVVKIAKNSGGSLKDALYGYIEDTGKVMHAGGTDAGYGLENVGYLFPDARNITDTPTFIQREQGWVNVVMNGCRHSPFSRIKTVHADITADEARAKGYVTGNRKMEEVFTLLKRTTTPTTIYKKQKLDRDDMVDITDMDVVAWIKAEMRMMLNEELARAILIGDGRSASSEDKINPLNIRPIAFDDVLYAVPVEVSTTNDKPEEALDVIMLNRQLYKGSGNPTIFVSNHVLTEWLLIKDTLGYRIYKTKEELASALNVKDIVAVEIMTDSTAYDVDSELYCIMVNLNDYTIGADAGGAVNMFDDFDIDYNQYKYLMETRVSGALTLPHSALVFHTPTSGGSMG